MKIPLSTALAPAWCVIVITTSPCTIQFRYMPFVNDESVSVSRTVPVVASLIWICSTRLGELCRSST